MRKELLPKVFIWMFVGLLVTFLTAYLVSMNTNLLEVLFSKKLWLVLILVQLCMVFAFSSVVKKMNFWVCVCFFIVYSIVTGLTFSTIFITFDVASVVIAFLITSILFCIMSFVGSVLKVDLSKYMTFFLIGLIGALIVTIINLFILKNPILDTVLCIVMICIFLVSVAQKIQSYLSNQYYASIPERNAVIMCAFGLYMDFIIIFRKVLRLMKKRKK